VSSEKIAATPGLFDDELMSPASEESLELVSGHFILASASRRSLMSVYMRLVTLGASSMWSSALDICTSKAVLSPDVSVLST
jgi:hypothetical protein